MDLRTYLTQQRGRARSLAAAVGVTPVTIHEWSIGQKKVPMERCTEIEKATDGGVTCEELRPDLAEHWAFLRGSASSEAAA